MKQMNTMKFTSVALKNLFSKPATRPYPEQPREYPDRTRGHVEVDIDTCVLCSLCARKCPTGAITVDRAAKLWEIERFGCIQCGCCVETCPKKCLSMKQSYTALLRLICRNLRQSPQPDRKRQSLQLKRKLLSLPQSRKRHRQRGRSIHEI